jgi:cation diffusion facilitator family transporter
METGHRRYDRAATRRVLTIILVLNIAVCVAKLVAGMMANSLAIISDALHSSIDALNNIFGIVLLRLAAKEPDAEHPYGHGKIETLGAFSIAAFMLITCYEITKQAGSRLLGKETAEFEITTFTLVVIGATLLVNIFVVLYEKAMARKYTSEFLYADAVHTQSDVLVTSSVLIGLPFVMRGYLFLDAVLALLVAGVIGWSVYGVLQRTVPTLLDAAAVDAGVVRRVALAIPGVVTVHDIRSRMHGGYKFVELTLVVAENDLREAHDITEELEKKIVEQCGPSSITIHIEPASTLPSR